MKKLLALFLILVSSVAIADTHISIGWVLPYPSTHVIVTQEYYHRHHDHCGHRGYYDRLGGYHDHYHPRGYDPYTKQWGHNRGYYERRDNRYDNRRHGHQHRH